MLKVKIIALGNFKNSHLDGWTRDFIKRLKPFCKLEIFELDPAKYSSLQPQERKEKEAELINSKITNNDFVVALDEHGKEMSSKQFSDYIKKKTNEGNSSFCFVIGGAYGLSDSIVKKANLVLSMSQLTFTYQMTFLLLVEQVYRALTLIKGTAYHKE